MIIYLQHRDGSVKGFESNQTELIPALKEINSKTIEEDDTGYFFETEYADDEYVKTIPTFTNEFGTEVGCEVVEVKEN